MGRGGAGRRLALLGTVMAVAAPAAGRVQQDVRDPPNPAQAPVSTDSGTVFARLERWTCPAEANDRFREYVATVWAPLFDEMTEEGRFLSWAALEPSGGREVTFRKDASALVQPIDDWTWTGLWTAASQEGLEASWSEYHRRLADSSHRLPEPSMLCASVRVSIHRTVGSKENVGLLPPGERGVVGMGVLVGSASSAVTGRALTRLLYDVEPTEPRVWTGVVAIIVLTAVISAWIPARRVRRLDPSEMLSAE